MILYRGPSQLDGSPIVAIATGHDRPSKNIKTGAMVQVWILGADLNPISAVMTGGDHGICGDCRHRGPLGNRSCYVNVGKAPTNVYRAYQKRKYAECADLSDFGRDRVFRLGAYGDPAAVPLDIWTRLLLHAAGWTGYTHHWRSNERLMPYVMASVDTVVERREAELLGWRTFRTSTSDIRMLDEIVCPASKEAGFKTTCFKCRLCNGQKWDHRKDIVIQIHGVGSKKYKENQDGITG